MTTGQNPAVQKAYGVRETVEEAQTEWRKYNYEVKLSDEKKVTETPEGKRVELPAAIYETKGHIAIITRNRPEAKNAADLQSMKDMNWCWHQVNDDDNVYVAILTGSGDSFSSGGDLKRMFTPYAEMVMRGGRENRAKALAEGRWPTHEEDPVAQHHWREIEVWKPIIAAVNGWCMAAGLTMALDCDIIIASERAMFGTPQGSRGIISGTCAQRLWREIPKAYAFKMLLTGVPLTAEEAYRCGMVSDLVPHEELLPTAMRIAEQVCTLSQSSVRAMKEAAYRALWHDFDVTRKIVADVSRRRLSEDPLGRANRRIGLMAFRDKKEPQFMVPKETAVVPQNSTASSTPLDEA